MLWPCEASVWQWRGNGVAKGCQCRGNGVAMARQWRGNGKVWHGNCVAIAWQWRGHGVAMGLPWCGNGVAMARQWRGNGVGERAGKEESRDNYSCVATLFKETRVFLIFAVQSCGHVKPRCGNGVVRAWQRGVNVVAMAWQWRGNGVAMARCGMAIAWQ